MAVKNSVAVYIDGINRTSHTVMPIKWGNFLDERLDEAYLTVTNIKRKTPFLPLTPVDIRLTNELYFHRGKPVEERSEEKQFIVADDSADETLVGKGYYTHTLYLIELTKYSECFVVDTITATNDLGRSYTENAPYAEPVWE